MLPISFAFAKVERRYLHFLVHAHKHIFRGGWVLLFSKKTVASPIETWGKLWRERHFSNSTRSCYLPLDKAEIGEMSRRWHKVSKAYKEATRAYLRDL